MKQKKAEDRLGDLPLGIVPSRADLLFDCRGAPLQVSIPHRAVQIDGRFGNSLKPIQI